jgi:hypothetical protein
MPNVFKLGEGPEHGHVNCSPFIARPAKLDPVKYLRCELRHPQKCPIYPISN